MHICTHCGRHRSDPRDYFVSGMQWPQHDAERMWVKVRAYTDEEARRQVQQFSGDRYILGDTVPAEDADKMPYAQWHTESIMRDIFGIEPPAIARS